MRGPHRADPWLARAERAGIPRRARQSLGRSPGYWHTALLTTLGTAVFVAGRGVEAQCILERAVDAGRRSGHALAHVLALVWSAVVHLDNGDVMGAESVVRGIDTLLERRVGLAAHYGTAMAYIARGTLHTYADRLAEADADLEHGVRLARRGDSRFEVVYGLTTHARLRHRLGDHDGAHRLVRQARWPSMRASTRACFPIWWPRPSKP